MFILEANLLWDLARWVVAPGLPILTPRYCLDLVPALWKVGTSRRLTQPYFSASTSSGSFAYLPFTSTQPLRGDRRHFGQVAHSGWQHGPLTSCSARPSVSTQSQQDLDPTLALCFWLANQPSALDFQLHSLLRALRRDFHPSSLISPHTTIMPTLANVEETIKLTHLLSFLSSTTKYGSPRSLTNQEKGNTK